MRHDALDAFRYQDARDAKIGSRAQAEALAERRRTLDRALASQADVADELVVLAAHAAPTGDLVELRQIEAGGPSAATIPATAPQRPGDPHTSRP